MRFKHKLLLSQKTHFLSSLFFTVFFFSNTRTHLLRSSPYTMVSGKSQGSSRHKGKEAISNPPTALDVGEEVEYSESEHSDKEKAQHDPNSECAAVHGMTSIFIFQRFLAIMRRRRYRAVCGLPFVGETPMFLGPRWPLRFPI